MKIWQDWIDEAQKGIINVQRCIDCKNRQFYPRDFCLECSSKSLEFSNTDGSGQVYSYTQVHRSPNPEIFKTPYFICLVEIEENIKIICNVLFKDNIPEIGKKVFFDKISNEGIIYYSD
jgi:hypothetical protein|tara:strand:+ start:56 stop:412 length:357 start_codon:yes stop_codon:yes gene_type:complete